MNKLRSLLKFDWLIFFIILSLSYIGITLLGSATHININGLSGMYRAQQIWIGLGIIVLIVVTFINYHLYSYIIYLFYGLSIVLLVLTLYSPLGLTVNGATRWISIGGLTLQPSELAKTFLILFFANYLGKNEDNINSPLFLIKITLLAIVPVFLIMRQPSLSASLVIIFVIVNMIFVAGLRKKVIITLFLLFTLFITFLLYDAFLENHILIDKVLDDYQITRITGTIIADVNDDNFYQTNYAISAISSGKLKGKGLYNGTLNKLSYLSESHNDLIFAVLGEEFGFIGTITVLAIIFMLILRFFIISFNTDELSGKLLVTGIGAMFFFQAFINVGVNTGIIPNTGMPFPFLSYGGSSMIINMFNVGLVLSVNYSNKSLN